MAYPMVEPRQLRRIRAQLGITQARLAEEAGVSQSLIAKIESDKVDPTFSSMKAITEALRVRRSANFKRAGEVMSSPVISVQADARLSECVALLRKHGVSQMPVFDGERLVGSVTEGHILDLLSEGRPREEVMEEKLKKLMRPAFPTVGRETPVDALVSLFNHVPAVLVSSGQRIEGIIAKIDLLAADPQR